MPLYLDSANINHVIKAFDSGLVVGITTNPSILARESKQPEEVIRELAYASRGIVFYQLSGGTAEECLMEANRFAALSPGRIGLKVPCTYENLVLASRLKNEGNIIGITAIFSSAQAYLAIQAGADFIIPYVNRSTRLQGNGLALVQEIRAVIEASEAEMEVLAASIKSPSEAVNAHLAGAHHLTLPMELIETMGNHRLSELAIDEFNQSKTVG